MDCTVKVAATGAGRADRTDAGGVGETMGKLGLRLERMDGQDTLEFDETEHKYVCVNDDGEKVECISVTTVISQHVFEPFDADAVIAKNYNR